MIKKRLEFVKNIRWNLLPLLLPFLILWLCVTVGFYLFVLPFYTLVFILFILPLDLYKMEFNLDLYIEFILAPFTILKDLLG